MLMGRFHAPEERREPPKWLPAIDLHNGHCESRSPQTSIHEGEHGGQENPQRGTHMSIVERLRRFTSQLKDSWYSAVCVSAPTDGLLD